MSGTSLDGIDVAMLVTDGANLVERGPSRTYPYDEAQRTILRQALADAVALTTRDHLPARLVEAERRLTQWHVEAVSAFRAEHPGPIDMIGFHGQTVIHRPDLGFTLQLGDGQALAQATGCEVAYDLRQADVQAGGQGAPLVPVYHQALAQQVAERPVAFVNIGGVANVTWIGAVGDPVAFDTGPGNALLNDWCERHLGEAMDRDGALAARGHLDATAFMTYAQHPFFETPAPKSLDRNAFSLAPLAGLRPEDGARTLVHFTATAIARAAAWFPARPKLWIICGGGRLNPTLMREIAGLLEPLGERVVAAEALGFNGDSMEAEAWAYLAVRSLKGLPISFPTTTGAPHPISGGVLAQP